MFRQSVLEMSYPRLWFSLCKKHHTQSCEVFNSTAFSFIGKLFGEILNIWGPVEFQSLAGNLQHNHFPIWLNEGSIIEFDLVQCSEKHIAHSLLKIADTSLNVIEDETKLPAL